MLTAIKRCHGALKFAVSFPNCPAWMPTLQINSGICVEKCISSVSFDYAHRVTVLSYQSVKPCWTLITRNGVRTLILKIISIPSRWTNTDHKPYKPSLRPPSSESITVRYAPLLYLYATVVTIPILVYTSRSAGSILRGLVTEKLGYHQIASGLTCMGVEVLITLLVLGSYPDSKMPTSDWLSDSGIVISTTWLEAHV